MREEPVGTFNFTSIVQPLDPGSMDSAEPSPPKCGFPHSRLAPSRTQMRRIIALLAVVLLPLYALGQDVPPTVSFKTDKATYKTGEEIRGTVTATFAPGLHGYQNPPDDPNLIPVTVKPGDGTTISSVTYPKGHVEMVAGAASAVYSGTVEFRVVIAAPTKPGKQKLNLGFYYQQCDASTCFMPTTIQLSAEVTIEGGAATPVGLRTTPRKATITASVPKVERGGKFVVNLAFSIPSGMYILAEASSLKVAASNDPLTVVSTSVPESVNRQIGDKRVAVYSGSVDIAVELGSIMVSRNSFGGELYVDYTLCDAVGEFRSTKATVQFNGRIEPSADPGSENSTSQPSVGTSSPDETPRTEPSSGGGLLGFLNNALEEGNWALIVPAALLAGLALCLTPCVFPMIPVTVTFFSNQGSKTTAGRLSLGLFYALGITITYGVVGGISAAAGGFVGELFTKQWFVLALAALLIALALSMFDVYEIRLPGFISKNLKGRSGPVGALIMGLLMGFAAAPCAGALVGAVAVKVADIGSIPTGLGMFGLIGLGMGLPFMVLATVSTGAKGLPKSGGWLKTTKAVLGLLVLYIAADYVFQGLGLKSTQASTQIAWIAVLGGFVTYLLFFDKSDATRAVAAIKGVAAVALGVLGGLAFASYQKITFDEEYARLMNEKGFSSSDSQIVGDRINWILYNDESFARAVASGKPILIDGRADWCKICHEMEKRVFNTPEGLIALSDVYLLEIDWSTKVPDEYKQMTKDRFKIAGLPHVVFMKPGGKDEFSVGDIKDVAELKGYLRRIGASK